MVGVNQTISIWCRVENTPEPGTVRALFWQNKIGTRLPSVGRRESSDHDVYTERFEGTNLNVYSPVWIRILHFNRANLSASGIYTCTANLAGDFSNHSVEVQVSGEW